jgi:hypothetical protein
MLLAEVSVPQHTSRSQANVSILEQLLAAQCSFVHFITSAWLDKPLSKPNHTLKIIVGSGGRAKLMGNYYKDDLDWQHKERGRTVQTNLAIQATL